MAAGNADVARWSTYFNTLTRFLESICRQHCIASQAYANYAIDRLSVSISNVSVLQDTIGNALGRGPLTPDDRRALDPLLACVRRLLQLLSCTLQQWKAYSDTLGVSSNSTCYGASAQCGRGMGRPRFDITMEQLEYLQSLNFTWTKIAALLGVSQMTVYHQRMEYGLLDESARAVELARIVQDLRIELRDIGESLVAGRLRSMGYRVARHRIRDTVRRSDPLNAALRWRGVVTCRPYSVPGPNSLWQFIAVNWGLDQNKDDKLLHLSIEVQH